MPIFNNDTIVATGGGDGDIGDFTFVGLKMFADGVQTLYNATSLFDSSMFFGDGGNNLADEGGASDGIQNIGIGRYSLFSVTTGYKNLAAGLPTYADDTSAGTGGLVTGDIYQKADGAGGFDLKIKA